MIANRNFGQNEPLTWIGQMPVYLATALAIAHGAALVLSALALAANLFGVVGALAFSTVEAVKSLHLWQFVTYAFIYNVPILYLSNAINIILLAMFGSEVEKFIGRRQFAYMYVALILAIPIFLTLVGFAGLNVAQLGSSGVSCFAVFLAFVFIYPRAIIFFGIEARWIGALGFGIYTLMYLAMHMWIALGTLWLECSVALFWMAKEGVQGMSLPSLPSFKSFAGKQHSKKHLKVVRRELEDSKDDEEYSLHDSIDPILDKIAKEGIASLTRGEREKLERARVALLEKEGRR